MRKLILGLGIVGAMGLSTVAIAQSHSVGVVAMADNAKVQMTSAYKRLINQNEDTANESARSDDANNQNAVGSKPENDNGAANVEIDNGQHHADEQTDQEMNNTPESDADSDFE